MIIGITGGIASGKTEVANFLKELGAVVIDTDEIAKEITKPGKDAYCEIIKTFGEDILLDNKEIDRKKLGGIVFSNIEARKKLEDITHPEIMREMVRRIRDNPAPIIFLIIPLLIEKNMQKIVDSIWLIKTREENQLSRLMVRDNLTEEEAQRRIKSQTTTEDKEKFADVIIKNDGDINEVKEKVRELYQKIR